MCQTQTSTVATASSVHSPDLNPHDWALPSSSTYRPRPPRARPKTIYVTIGEILEHLRPPNAPLAIHRETHYRSSSVFFGGQPNSLGDIFMARQKPPSMRDPCTLKSLRWGGRGLHSAQPGDCQAKTERSEK